MFTISRFFGLTALAAALILGGADLAAARNSGSGRGPGNGPGVCVQSGQYPAQDYQYQRGQGKGQGQRLRQQRRDGSCVNPATSPPPATAAPTK